MKINTQDLNKKIQDPVHNKEIMLNRCTREGITELLEMKEMYDLEYPKYVIDTIAAGQLPPLMAHKKVTIVMGTWCGDSKYQVPHFYKIMDALSVPADDINLICVDGNKRAENELIDKLDIERIPTFIFYDGGKEIGRIVESPEETLEKDMVKIL